ncbi:hypothetical protein [Streptomyces sp. CLCI03]
MTDELTSALHAIPGYDDRDRAVATINERLNAVRTATFTVDPNAMGLLPARQKLTEQIVDLAAGGRLPDDLAAHNWGSAWRDSMRLAENQNLLAVLTEAAQRAEDARQFHIEQNSAPAFQHLHERLQSVLQDTRTTGPTPENVQAYTDTRAAQTNLTIQVMNPGPPQYRTNIRPTLDLLFTAGEMADQFEQWPRWTKNGKPGSPQDRETPPWPLEDRAGRDSTFGAVAPDVRRRDYSPAYLKWAAGSSAHFWVPTIPQLQAAARRHQALEDARLVHAQAVKQQHLPPSRWTIPAELSLPAMLATFTEKEHAHA